jgi:hypothetical protein
MSQNITLTGTFESIAGASTGYVSITLVNFGTAVPVVAGIGVISLGVIATTLGASFSQALFGNDQISPAGTYYQINVYSAAGSLISSGAYQFTGTQTIDLSAATPYITPGLISSSFGS